MFNIIKKQLDGKADETIVLATAGTLDEAEILLIDFAQKDGAKFEDVNEGFYLVKKDRTIEKYEKSIKTMYSTGITSWFSSPTIKQDSTLVEIYSIVNANTNTETQAMEPSTENHPLRVLILVNQDGSLSCGYIKSSEKIDVENVCVEDVCNKLEQLRATLTSKYDKIDVENVCTKDTTNKLEQLRITLNGKNGENDKNCENDKNILTNKEYNLNFYKELVKLLSDKRAKDYLDWARTNYALHNIDDSLYDCFIEFSLRGSRNLDDCKRIWPIRMREYGIQNLHEWASKDNPEKYMKLIKYF